MRYFLELSYNGLPFHGWQRQPNANSVQQTIEEALSTILRCDTPATGAGRTDTGVHARRMYAHFDTQTPIEDDDRFIKSINRMVGKNISIQRIIHVAADAHARFDATERSYKYFVIFDKSPFLNDSSWLSPGSLDVDKMNLAAEKLIGVQDFTSFAKLHTDVKTNICDVRKAFWEKYENPFGVRGIVFTITADRFLRNMVRAVVGTLVDVGRGKITPLQFEEIIKIKDRCSAGTSMPPQALYLWDVKYPFISDNI